MLERAYVMLPQRVYDAVHVGARPRVPACVYPWRHLTYLQEPCLPLRVLQLVKILLWVHAEQLKHHMSCGVLLSTNER